MYDRLLIITIHLYISQSYDKTLFRFTFHQNLFPKSANGIKTIQSIYQYSFNVSVSSAHRVISNLA